jgi:predicted metalloprotease with PDZ domain
MRALLHSTDGGSRLYSWTDIQAALESVAPGDWKAFEQRYIHGTEPLPVGEALARVGLRMTESADGVVRVEANPAATPKAKALRRALERGSR